jgi:hypothetical protein
MTKFLDPSLNAHANARSKSFGVTSRSKADAIAKVQTDAKHKYTGEDKDVANDAFDEASLSEQQQKSKLFLQIITPLIFRAIENQPPSPKTVRRLYSCTQSVKFQ